MLIVGGEKQGDLSDEVWRFHFGIEKQGTIPVKINPPELTITY